MTVSRVSDRRAPPVVGAPIPASPALATSRRSPARGRPGGPDAGVATIWVAALLVLVLTATVLAVAGATATASRHAAQLAADLAALAAAGRLGVDDATACAAAGRVAGDNGATLRACTVTVTGARTGEVRVEVDRAARWSGLDLTAHARARAARVAPGGAVNASGAHR